MSVLVLRFLAAALLYFVAALILGIAQQLNLYSPTYLHVHLALVGFVCGVIIATMYQQVPTLTGTELYSARAARTSFWLFNIGLLTFSATYPKFRVASSVGALLLLFSFYLFTYNILATISNRKGENYVFKFYAASSIMLSLGATLGFLMVLNPLLTVFKAAHAHFTLVGGVALIIMGAMSWMLPMLVVKDIYNRRWLDYVFYTALFSSLGMALGFASSRLLLTFSGVVLLLAALLFSYDMLRSYTAPTKVAMKPKPVEAKFFLAALAYFVFTLLIGLAMVLFPSGRSFTAAHAHLAALGFVVQTVVGGLYHVIPTLAWTRLLPRERDRAPASFRELFSENRSKWIFYAFNAGVLLLAVGFALAMDSVVLAGAILVALAGLVFAGEMLAVIKRAGVLP